MSQETIRTLEGVTWDCSACGSCCRGYEFGPVSRDIVEGLKRLDIESHWEPAARQPWVEVRRGPEGSEAYYFAKVDDHCVFLQPDNLCAIHGRFGAEAKPAFCREFPYHTVRDPAGLVAIVRADCAGFYKTFSGATPLVEGAREVATLRRITPERVFQPETVPLLPGVEADLSGWLDLEDRILGRIEAGPVDPEAALREAWSALMTAMGRPDGPRDPKRGRMALTAVLGALQHVMRGVLASGESGGTAAQQAFAQQMAGWVDRALERVSEPLPPLTEDARAYLHVVVRSFLLARQWESAGSVGAGLGRMGFHLTVCRLLADRDDAGAVTAAAWSDRYVKWNRFAVNRAVSWTMGKATPAFVDLARHGV